MKKLSATKIDVAYLTLFQGLNYAIPLLLTPYLMYVLGAKNYGLIGFSQAVMAYLVLITDFGFNLSATKRIATYVSNKVKLSKIFYSTVAAKIFFFIISSSILIILYFIPQLNMYRFALICGFPLLLGSTFTFTWFFQGIGEIRKITFMSTIARFLIIPLIFFYVKSPEDVYLAIFLQSLVFLVTAIFSLYWIYYRCNLLDKVEIKRTYIYYEIKESYPLFLSTASVSIYTQFFIIILGLTASAEAVGRYSATDKIVRSLTVLFYNPIMQVFYPKIVTLVKTNTELAFKTFKKLLISIAIIMLCASVVIFFSGGIVEHFLKGYKGIGNLLKIAAITPFFIGIGGVIGQIGLLALGNKRDKFNYQKTYLIAGPCSLVLVLILTRTYQETGALLSMVLTEFIVFLLMIYYFNVKNKRKKNILLSKIY